jgi:peptidoglycan/xylan/chitin deacetylase (PgdA/CDA1 family)
MLRFNKILVLTVVLLTGSLMLNMHPVIPVTVVVVFILLVTYGVLTIGSGMFVKAVCKTGEKGVLLTFDDGPDPETTPVILKALKKHEVKAIFFMTGEKAAKYPELLRKISDDGHVIGNHTFRHSNFFPVYSVKKMVGEINRTSEIIEDATGRKVTFFRPPFGITNPNVGRAVRKTGKKVIGWSLRSFDTVAVDAQAMKDKILNNIKDGDIVLFHDTRVQTARILDNFIEVCIERGFEFFDAGDLPGVSND